MGSYLKPFKGYESVWKFDLSNLTYSLKGLTSRDLSIKPFLYIVSAIDPCLKILAT